MNGLIRSISPGWNGVLGPHDHQQRDVVGDVVAEQVRLDDVDARRDASRRPPEPEARLGRVELAGRGLAVARGEADLRPLPLAEPDQGGGHDVLAVEGRDEPVGPGLEPAPLRLEQLAAC